MYWSHCILMLIAKCISMEVPQIITKGTVDVWKALLS